MEGGSGQVLSVTFTPKDGLAYASTTQTVLIDVIDPRPVFTNQPAIPIKEATSAAGAVVSFPMPTATSSLGNVLVVADPPSGSVFPLGESAVTFTASDSAGNFRTTSATVTVVDTTAPSFSQFPSDMTVEAVGSSGAAVAFSVSATDSVTPSPNIIFSKHSGSLFLLGTTTVTLAASDSAGNVKSGAFNVTVVDTTKPFFVSAPPNLTVEATSASGAVVNYPLFNVLDSVSTPVVSASIPSGSVFSLGTKTVTLSARDAANNETTAMFSVKVVDTTPPVISGLPASITVEAADPSGVPVNLPVASMIDAVGGGSVTTSVSSGHVFLPGESTVTYSATDAAGNKSSQDLKVYVSLGGAPRLKEMPVDLTVEATGPDGAVVKYPMPKAEDGAGIKSLVSSHPSGAVFPLGTTSVTVTAVNKANQSTSASFNIKVVDTTPPTLSGVSPNIRVSAEGPKGAVVAFPMPVVSDVVGGTVLSVSKASGTTFPLGETKVTFSARDAFNNTREASFTVEVVDKIAPKIVGVPGNMVVQANVQGGARVTFKMPSMEDLVGGGTITASPAPGSIFGPGITKVLITATDGANNTSTASFTVNVVDTAGPVFSEFDPEVVVRSTEGTKGQKVFFAMPVVSDNVGVVSYTASRPSGSIFPLGKTPVTLTAKDASGNSTQATMVVSVVDMDKPQFSDLPGNMKVELTRPEGAYVNYKMPKVTDNVGVASVSANRMPGALFPVGYSPVFVSALDAAGNYVDYRFDVEVVDTVAPKFVSITKDISVSTDDAQGAIVDFTLPAVSDASGNVSVSSSKVSGSLFPVGSTTVFVTAEDDSGNRSVTSFRVNVVDRLAPVFSNVPSDMTVEATGPDGTAVTFSNPKVSLPGFTLSSSPASGSKFAVGDTSVVFTASGPSGRKASVQFKVRVVDTGAPKFTKISEEITVEATGPQGALATFALPEASDLVSPVSVTCVPASGSVFPLGRNTVVATARDRSGNETESSFVVNVVDTSAPAISGVPANITTVATSSLGAAVTFPMASALDAVGGGTISALPVSGSTFPIGTTPVVFLARDGKGNRSAASFNVTVLAGSFATVPTGGGTLGVPNRAPSFLAGGSLKTGSELGEKSFAKWATLIHAGSASESAQKLEFSVTCSNYSLFEVPPRINAGGTLSFTPIPGASGVATLGVRLRDDGGTADGGEDTSAEQSVALELFRRNAPPSFTAGADIRVFKGEGKVSISDWAKEVSAGAPYEADQKLKFEVRVLEGGSLLKALPVIDSSGTLVLEPAGSGTGVARFGVKLRDSGGTSDGGTDVSEEKVLRVQITDGSDLAGSYIGLIQPPEGTDAIHSNTGIASIAVSSKGAVSGRVKMCAADYQFTAKLSAAGKVLSTSGSEVLALSQKGQPLLSLSLRFYLGASHALLGGSISAANLKTAEFSAERFEYASSPASARVPAGLIGAYTLLMRPDGEPAGPAPKVPGFATMSVANAGGVSLVGKLADGSAISASLQMVSSGRVPIYFRLYGNAGSVNGELTVESETALIDGWMDWYRPAKFGAVANPFLEGWAKGTSLEVEGSIFKPQKKGVNLLEKVPAVDSENGNVEARVSGGGLGQELVIPLNWTANAGSPIPKGKQAAIAISEKTGVLSGSFRHPVSGATVTLQGGVVLQGQGVLEGFFLGPEAGWFRVGVKSAP